MTSERFNPNVKVFNNSGMISPRGPCHTVVLLPVLLTDGWRESERNDGNVKTVAVGLWLRARRCSWVMLDMVGRILSSSISHLC